jgi:hypothetical protein
MLAGSFIDLGAAARAARLQPGDRSWRSATRPARYRNHGALCGACCRAARPTDHRAWSPSREVGQSVCGGRGLAPGRTQCMARTPRSRGAPCCECAGVRVFVRLNCRLSCLRAGSPKLVLHACSPNGSQPRNYQYQIVEGQHAVAVLPGKMSLAFSLAVNVCRHFGIDPATRLPEVRQQDASARIAPPEHLARAEALEAGATTIAERRPIAALSAAMRQDEWRLAAVPSTAT